MHVRPFFRVRLGRTRFSDLPSAEWSPSVRAIVGARLFSYSEAYYLGNPGFYQTFVFTASSAAYHAPFGPVEEVSNRIHDRWVGGLVPCDEDEEIMRDLSFVNALEHVRRETAITTYTVLGPELLLDTYPLNFGPHGDEVRTLQ
jgi:hypothetical protein